MESKKRYWVGSTIDAIEKVDLIEWCWVNSELLMGNFQISLCLVLQVLDIGSIIEARETSDEEWDFNTILKIRFR